MQPAPIWRRYPGMFRGARGLVWRLRTFGTWELNPVHRLVELAMRPRYGHA